MLDLRSSLVFFAVYALILLVGGNAVRKVDWVSLGSRVPLPRKGVSIRFECVLRENSIYRMRTGYRGFRLWEMLC